MASIGTQRYGDNMAWVLEDGEGPSRARVLPGCGFNCYSFECTVAGKTFELLRTADGFAEDLSGPEANGIPILFPFPNRLREGRFEFDDKRYQLPRNEPGGANAIHGLVLDRRWRIHASGHGLVGEFLLTTDDPESEHLWPADFKIQIEYQLVGNTLSCRVNIYNPELRTLPWGLGLHPWFRLPLEAEGDETRCKVLVPASDHWALSGALPEGHKRQVTEALDLREGRPLSELALDDVLTSLVFKDGWCECLLQDEAAGVEVSLRFDGLFREIVVYNPPERGAICLEPYTCVTDAANLEPRGIDAGWRTLGAGQCVSGMLEIEARPLEP